MNSKKTLVIGASENPERYANKAVRMLQEHDVPVVAFGRRKGEINGTPITTEFPAIKDIHSVSLYLSAKNQEGYYQKIIDLQPQRVIFNPGTENPEFVEQLNRHGIVSEIACTLVLLRTKAF